MRLYTVGFCDQWASWFSLCGWTEEPCSQHPFEVGVLVMYLNPCIDWLVTYWKPCIKRRDCHYITSPIVYWGKDSTVGWCTRIPLLVIACFDNSGFSRVVTLNSLDEVFALEVFPIPKQITMSNLFSAAFSYLVICLCYHTLLHINWINKLTWLNDWLIYHKESIHSWPIMWFQSRHTLIMVNLCYVIRWPLLSWIEDNR